MDGLKRAAFGAVGLGGLAVFGYIGWEVGKELTYQSRMQPVIDKAVAMAQHSRGMKGHLTRPPWKVHGGGRHSVRPIFRKTADPRLGTVADETVFWVEDAKGRRGRMTVISREGELEYVAVDIEGSTAGPVVVLSRRPERRSEKRSWLRKLVNLF